MRKIVSKLVLIREMLHGIKKVPNPIISQLERAIDDLKNENNIDWIKVNSKDDLPKESACFYFVLHNHEKVHVCCWDIDRITDMTAKTISHWVEIKNLPDLPLK